MRFQEYLIENKKIEQTKMKLAKQLDVDSKYLDYIGDDKFGYYFNITDPKHKEYKSTKFIKK
jgi:hypothetical protein